MEFRRRETAGLGAVDQPFLARRLHGEGRPFWENLVDERSSQRDPIATAVATCVSEALKAERPFRHVNDFLLMLQRAKWSETDLLAVQNGVLAALRDRRIRRQSAMGEQSPNLDSG
jgi:hypothetical protein